MAEEIRKPLRGKVILNGHIKCVTGLHIGSSRDSLDIGGMDAPVLRNPVTREPYIPGSSLKGKLRSLFERRRGMDYNRGHRVGGQDIRRHECTKISCPVCRLFGATAERQDERNLPARLIVRDCFLTRDSEKQLTAIDTGLQYTELKFENALDRITAAANPRQIERVPAGAEFLFEAIYNVEISQQPDIREDLTHLLETLLLLEDDFLGGHGSRGYGKIHFEVKELIGRTVDFYSATTAAEQNQRSTLVKVKTVTECKEQLPELLRLFP
jgi:CRISPR-associated protein Csm3